MKTSTLLRAAAVLSLLHFLGHSVGFPWTPSDGDQSAAVLGGMKSFRFDVFGSTRTYWDFYLGFGLTISVLLLLEAVVLWFLASVAVKEPRQARRFIGVFLLANLAQVALVLRFFFLPPLILSVANTLCLVLALWVSRARPEPARP
jgi:hypothetical protein